MSQPPLPPGSLPYPPDPQQQQQQWQQWGPPPPYGAPYGPPAPSGGYAVPYPPAGGPVVSPGVNPYNAYQGPAPPYPPAAPYSAPPPAAAAYGADPAAAPYPYDKSVYGRSSQQGSTDMIGGAPAPAETMISDQISTQIRHAFVRKVMGILSLQILLTFGVASLFAFVPPLKEFLIANYWLAILSCVLALVLQLVLVCVPNLARRVPANFILMTFITLCYAVLISYGAISASVQAFLIAIGTTFVVCTGLMLFACQTKYDFTGCGAFVFVAVLVLLVYGIVCIFFVNKIMHMVYSGLATLLFCFILVYDTQQVVGGKHRKFQYSVDDYIFAALTLYMDIIIIFMNILALADSS